MSVSKHSPLAALEQPYPGLRAFEPYESFLFFGRETHTEELLRRLVHNRFLAVVGTSGGGKSSLVRAGLLPALYRGYLVGSTSRWRIAIMRPGSAPIAALATALAAPEALGPKDDDARRKTLGATSLGLLHAVHGAGLEPGESMLLVVDQFEELFRFAGEQREEDAGTEAAFFVSLLLQAAEQPKVPIYVVITMRSDFLGDCAQFPGLPEALNQGQYLIPRLTREQRRHAIESPLYLAGVGMTPPLIQRLLNDAGDNPDQLPVLQHALLRTFRHWQEVGSQGDVDVRHYEEVGGISHALNHHAEEIHASFSGQEQALTAKLFRCLTTVQGGRAVRRPARFDRLCQVVGIGDVQAGGQVAAIIQRFADPDNSLLLLSSHELGADTVVDISHESLIRKWDRLKQWVAQEVKSADWYCDLARDALRHQSGEVGLYRDPDLSRILQRRDDEGWNQAWAAQYWPSEEPSFQETRQFLHLSDQTQQEERQREEARRRKELEDARRLARAHKRIALLAGLLLLIGVIAAAIVYYQDSKNKQQIAAMTRQYQAIDMKYRQAVAEAESRRIEIEKAREALQTGSEEDRNKLEARLQQLQRDYSDAKTEADRARSQLSGLQTSAAALKKSDPASPLKPISDLRDQLAQVTRERDALQSQIDTFQTVQTRDVSYWQSRVTQAESQLKEARQNVMELERRSKPPAFVILPQYSVIHLEGPAFVNRVALGIGDVKQSRSAEARIWVWTSSGKEPLPPDFYEDEEKARQIVGSLAKEECKADGVSGRWCFAARKEQVIARPQELGSFRLGGISYSVVATSWRQNAIGTTDVISLVIYPSPAVPATK